jgi:hypothetical protein
MSCAEWKCADQRAAMPHYRVYFLDPRDIFTGAQDIPAPDDREAAKKARQLLDRQDLKLWDGERLIARFDHDRPWPKNE